MVQLCRLVAAQLQSPAVVYLRDSMVGQQTRQVNAVNGGQGIGLSGMCAYKLLLLFVWTVGTGIGTESRHVSLEFNKFPRDGWSMEGTLGKYVYRGLRHR